MDGKSIATLESVKDLGVLITQDLSWDGYYKAVSYKTLEEVSQSVAQLQIEDYISV